MISAESFGLDPGEVIGKLVYGVGTKLITSSGDPALDGVYKLTAIQDDHGTWVPASKFSETPEKVVNPGDKRLWRLYDRNNMAVADLIGLSGEDPSQEHKLQLHHPANGKIISTCDRNEISGFEPLLVTVKKESNTLGEPAHRSPQLDELRERRRNDLERLSSKFRRLVKPEPYPVALTTRLWDLKQELLHSTGRSI